MDEFLKTIRFLHQVLIGVCAALIAFSLSPDPKAQYTAALVELNVILGRLTLHDYVLYAKTVAQHDDEEEGAYLKRRFAGKGKLVVKNYALPISQNLVVTRPFFCEYPKDNATVAEYLLFFDGGGLIGEVGFENGEIPGFKEKLVESLRAETYKELNHFKPELQEVSFELSEEIPQERFPRKAPSGDSQEAPDNEFEFAHGATRLLNVPRLGQMGLNISPPDKREFRGEIRVILHSDPSGFEMQSSYDPPRSYFYGKKLSFAKSPADFKINEIGRGCLTLLRG